VSHRQYGWPPDITADEALRHGYDELMDMAAELAAKGRFDGD
jgi:hypothetical protein